MNILLIDNYDSFTYNIVQYLRQLSAQVFVYKNDDKNLINNYSNIIRENNIQKIILSPGAGKADDIAILFVIIQQYYNKLPVLGICLGHQALAIWSGAQIILNPHEPRHGKVSNIEHSNIGCFSNIPQNTQATRYHSLCVNEQTLDITNQWQITARSLDDNLIMGIQHQQYNLHGIQFHPESIGTPCGLEILANFLDLQGYY